MKKYLIAAALITTLNSGAWAQQQDNYSDAKQFGVVSGSMITGAVAGGPLGALAGMAAGIWLAEQVHEADQRDIAVLQLSRAEQRIEQLQLDLYSAEKVGQDYADLALSQLQLELLFKTGASELTEAGLARMDYLARFLRQQPALQIKLDGYADPRGDVDYNASLSKQRVNSVAKALAAAGVDPERIETFYHGASASTASPGDYDAYAMERKVRIELLGPKASARISLAE